MTLRPMRVLDRATAASGAVNEDRAGASGRLAWVIDGATDILDRPLTAAASDASWIAGQLDHALSELHAAVRSHSDLVALPAQLSARMRHELSACASRMPAAAYENPSAAGIVLAHFGDHLGYVQLGDCSLLVADASGVRRFGPSDERAGDAQLASAIEEQSRRMAERDGGMLAEMQLRHAMLPTLRAARSHMNREGGYAILSIEPPPPALVLSGTFTPHGDCRLLLASDGLMRLVDVFHRYDDAKLMAAATAKGLAPLIAELREIEHDESALARPRIKRSDDATGLLIGL
ncbi:MAG: protein phosphatase 2C domain-containing protein [Hyphomicrobiaceae bacterium]